MARYNMAKLGHPSEVDYKDMVCSNMIDHIPLNLSDIDAANNIFSCNIPSLKLKTPKRHPPQVLSDYMTIPKQIKDMTHRIMI